MADEYVLKSSVLNAIHNGDIDMGMVTTREYRLLKDLSERIDWRIQRVPAADVAHVVRCRDCKHSYKFRGDLRRCTRHTEGVPGRPIVVEDDDFCCWGRKTEEVQK